MGHGKENYIKICVSDAGTPGFNVTKKRIYCTCFANKLEANYDKIMETLEQTLESTGDLEKAQNKANGIAKKYALECIDLIKSGD